MDHISQLPLLHLGKPPIDGQLFKALAADLFAFAAPQHVHHHFDSKPLPQIAHAGENFPGLGGDVHPLKAAHAVLTVAALGGGVLPKIVKNVFPQAAGGVAIAGHGPQPLLVLLGKLFQNGLVYVLIFFPVGEEKPVQGHVRPAV